MPKTRLLADLTDNEKADIVNFMYGSVKMTAQAIRAAAGKHKISEDTIRLLMAYDLIRNTVRQLELFE